MSFVLLRLRNPQVAEMTYGEFNFIQLSQHISYLNNWIGLYSRSTVAVWSGFGK